MSSTSRSRPTARRAAGRSSRCPPHAVVTAEGFVASLRQLPGEGGVFGIVSIADEFFILAHTVRDGVRLMISDAASRCSTGRSPRRPPR